MRRGTMALLVLSSLVNAVLCAGSFLFGLFATSPTMADVTMRIGFYVLNLVAVAAAAGVFLPWLFANRQQTRAALFFALLPAFLACLSVVAFLTLDSWLNRNFSDRGQNPEVPAFAGAMFGSKSAWWKCEPPCRARGAG